MCFSHEMLDDLAVWLTPCPARAGWMGDGYMIPIDQLLYLYSFVPLSTTRSKTLIL